MTYELDDDGRWDNASPMRLMLSSSTLTGGRDSSRWPRSWTPMTAAGRAADTTAGEYEVIVRATDPSGVADVITITITVTDANEAPSIDGTGRVYGR